MPKSRRPRSTPEFINSAFEVSTISITRAPERRRRFRFRRRIVLALLAALVAASASADLAILVGGDVMKIESFRLEGERMHLRLPSGGGITLDIRRIERIVDDEIVDEPVPVVPEEPAVAGFRFDFAESDQPPDVPYGKLFFDVGREHSLNPSLLAAMARAESAYDAEVTSHKGARGLMQVMPATAERFGVSPSSLFEPSANALAAARYIVWLRKRFDDDLAKVLAGYNAGEGTVDRYDGVPPYKETVGYIARVKRFLGLPEAADAASGNGAR